MNASYLWTALALVSTVAGAFAQAPPAVAVAAPELPIDPAAANMFPAKVQPVLMNLCARCHCRPDHPSAFKLSRVSDGYANAQATGRNLRATAAFVRADNPSVSPLLLKAVSPHGGAKDPPLLGRGHPAFKHLETWASHALIGASSGKPEVVLAAAPSSPSPPANTQNSLVGANLPEPARLPPLPSAEPLPTVTPAPSSNVGMKPHPDDPYDPAAFNQIGRGGK